MTAELFGIFLYALACIESGGDPSKPGKNNDVGILQITPIMVEECNRIVGHNRWTLADRYDIVESYEMARTFYEHHGDDWSVYKMARVWNQGIKGYRDSPDNEEAHDHATRVNNIYRDILKKRGM